MNCEKFNNIAFELAAGELPADEAADAERHMLDCPDCRREYEENLKLIEALNAAGEVEAPDDLLENVMNRLPAGKPIISPRLVRYGASAAAAVLLVAGTVTLYPMLQKNIDDPDIVQINNEDITENNIKYIADGEELDLDRETSVFVRGYGGESDDQVTDENDETIGYTTDNDMKEQSSASVAGGEESNTKLAKQDVNRSEEMGGQSATDKRFDDQQATSPEQSKSNNEGVAPMTIGPGQEAIGVMPRQIEATSGNGVVMGDNAIDTPEVAQITPELCDTDEAVSEHSGSSSSGGSARGGGASGGSARRYVANTVTFTVSPQYAADASSVNPKGKSRAKVEEELRSLGIPFTVDVITVDYSSEYYATNSQARRTEIEELCKTDRCEIIFVE